MGEFLEEIRKIRDLKNPNLKPSPYLRETFIDEYGIEQKLSVRDYQKIGILNMCMCERMLLADDTGLGKTLQLLQTIGYVWLLEPHYIPIIVTNKSSQFQWANEIIKMCKNMEAVTVEGIPAERHKQYSEFFQNYNLNKKRVLIITYDMLFRDLREQVISERLKGKGSTKIHRTTKEAKMVMEETKTELDILAKATSEQLSPLPFEIQEYASSTIRGEQIKAPNAWNEELQELVDNLLGKKAVWEQTKDIYDKAHAISNPVQKVEGILNYAAELQQEYPESKFMLVMDEIHKLKNTRSQIHANAKELSELCVRVYGMTATPVKNRLMEFFSIFQIIRPGLFTKVSHFMNDYCVTKLQPIGGGRKVPIVVGYKNLNTFTSKIEPFFISRKKHEVAKELPQLITRELRCELSNFQEELYDMAESGLLTKSDDGEENEAEILQSLTLCQQAADSPCLIADEDGNPFDGDSVKEEILVDLLNNDLDGRKVIVFSRFERMISRIEIILNNEKIKNVRITGKEFKAKDREKIKNIFQDPTSGTNVILITNAGAESINLHAAEYLVFYDSPWSWGDYVQLIGRMVRIGSRHKGVVAIHLLAVRQNGDKTIDQHVVKTLRSKKVLADKVAGQNLPDALSFKSSSEANDIMTEMMRGRQPGGKGTLLAKSNAKTRKKTASKKGAQKSPRKAIPDEGGVVKTISIDLSDI